MLQVDRKNYVIKSHLVEPYADSPQSIGYGVTISAPHMHAHCLELLKDHLKPGMRALDVGSGSGYLSAVMALMVGETGKVFGIECISEVAQKSIENVKIDNPKLLSSGQLTLQVGDGYKGLPDKAPFDCIHVGAAAARVPDALLSQLKVGGRMVIPEGPQDGTQYLVQIDKLEDGTFEKKPLMGVRYVPLVEKDSWA